MPIPPEVIEVVVDGSPEVVEVDVGVPVPGGGGGGSVDPATTVVHETTFGGSAVVGMATKYAREDHTHGTPALGTSGTTACAGDDARLSNARTPTAHTHPESDITNLVSDLAGKAATVHTHAESDVTGLVSDLAAKAPLASPTFTGVPAAPTPTAADNSTKIATTAFVLSELATAIANLVASAPGTLDTLNELAIALGNDPNFAATITTALAGKVPTTRTVNGQALSADVTVSTITGNSGTATALQNARLINGTSFNGTADITVTAAAGSLTGSSLNATITGSSLTSVGMLVGLTVSATITGSVSGNAGTATALQNARLINGTSFNGTADITVTAAAGTLTGSTLNATITGSSLTGVGTITVGVWNGTTIAIANGGTGATSASAARTALGLAIGTDIQAFNANATKGIFGITIDGGGSVPSTGIKGYFRVPWNGTITKVTLIADQTGSAVIDVWKDTYANYPPTIADTITASALPTLSSANKAEDSTLTGWNKTINAGDVFGYNLNSCTTCTRLTLEIEYTLA